MLIIGDHKSDKKFKYEYYPKEKPNETKTYTTFNRRKLIRLENTNHKRINYSIWLMTLNKDRIEYLKRIGIADFNKLQTLSKISFNLLPYDIRSKLQTRLSNESNNKLRSRND